METSEFGAASKAIRPPPQQQSKIGLDKDNESYYIVLKLTFNMESEIITLAGTITFFSEDLNSIKKEELKFKSNFVLDIRINDFGITAKEVAEAELSTYGHTLLETLHAELQEYEGTYFYNLGEILLEEKFFIQRQYDEKLNELFLDGWNKGPRNEYFSKIEIEIDFARKINNKNQGLVELYFEEDAIRAQLAYCRAMEEKMTGAYIKPDVLEEYHNELVSEACKKWEEEAKKTDVETRLRLEKQIERMKFNLDGLYRKFKNWNEANKSLLRRVVGGISGVVGAAGVGGGAVAGTVLAEEVTSITATAALASSVGIGLGILAGVSVAGIAFLVGKKYLENKDKSFFAEECHDLKKNLENVQSSHQ
uniref:uncharacterized protein LOC120333118 n=1 Tax=Styela clava TaxID=7725 RepID=UPI001939C7AF|nr:uncharacterized protein LOC120333118 [Styela clava]